MNRISLVLAWAFLPAIGLAQTPPQSIDVIDFLVDGPTLIGKTVTVTGCKFSAATMSSVLCSAGMPGNFPVAGQSLDKEDLRRALKTCSGFADNPTCVGSVTGRVAKGPFSLTITGGKIDWAQ